jgi:hypothetical protein
MASRFWVLGTGTWDTTTSTAHWAATSNGAPGQSVPGSGDTVTFDANSGGGTVTPDYNMTVTSITMSAFTGTLDFSANNVSPTISGNFNNSGSGVRNLKMGNGTWLFTGTSSQFSQASVTNLTFAANGSTIKFTNSSGTTLVSGGGKTFNNLWVATTSTGVTKITDSNTWNDIKVDAGRTLNVDTGKTQTITTLTCVGTVSNRITLKCTTSTEIGAIGSLSVIAAGSSYVTSPGASRHPTLTGGDGTGQGNVDTVDGGGGVTGISVFAPGSLYNVGTTYSTTNVVGTGLTLRVDSLVAPIAPWTLSCASGTINVSFCDIQGCTASGGATFNANDGTNRDNGLNSGWRFPQMLNSF